MGRSKKLHLIINFKLGNTHRTLKHFLVAASSENKKLMPQHVQTILTGAMIDDDVIGRPESTGVMNRRFSPRSIRRNMAGDAAIRENALAQSSRSRRP